jgi:hypothetical protein
MARELGQLFAEAIKVQVLEEIPNTLYLVIPRNPAQVQLSE